MIAAIKYVIMQNVTDSTRIAECRAFKCARSCAAALVPAFAFLRVARPFWDVGLVLTTARRLNAPHARLELALYRCFRRCCRNKILRFYTLGSQVQGCFGNPVTARIIPQRTLRLRRIYFNFLGRPAHALLHGCNAH
eukprot:4343719-Pleurochrysis_carterae.AAC.1